MQYKPTKSKYFDLDLSMPFKVKCDAAIGTPLNKIFY